MKKKVLILSPHTDDGELGAGGYISKLFREGNEIHWVVFSSARASVPDAMDDDVLANEFKAVMEYLEIPKDRFTLFDYEVRRLNENRQDVLELLVKIRNDFDPDLVIGPSLKDFHQDHQVVANEMIRAFKSSASILCYELPWNHIQFENQYFVELTEDDINKKLKMLSFYESQLVKGRVYFSEDFIRGLASTRGVQIGAKYAEAFEVLKWIERK